MTWYQNREFETLTVILNEVVEKNSIEQKKYEDEIAMLKDYITELESRLKMLEN